MLFDEMMRLRRDFSDTPDAAHFKQPIFHIMVLFVDEAESIARQLKRGRRCSPTTRRSGAPVSANFGRSAPPTSIRSWRAIATRSSKRRPTTPWSRSRRFSTTTSSTPRRRWSWCGKTSSASWNTKAPWSSIPRTFDLLRKLPLASEIIRHARQDLVRRLDNYKVENPELMQAVVDFIEAKMMPIIVRHAISGRANINSENRLFHDPLALAMLIDIFSERGFHATVDLHHIEIPERFDPDTGAIHCRIKKVFRFNIHFKGSEIRRG
jgi:adenylate kinase